MQRECLAQEAFCFGRSTRLADDAAQQTERVGGAELVAELALLGEALRGPVPAALVIAGRPVEQGQPGQCVAYAVAVTEFAVLGQRTAEAPACGRIFARIDGGEAEVVVRLRDPAGQVRPGIDDQRLLEVLPRVVIVP